MKSSIAILLLIMGFNLSAQVGRVGINETDPEVELDIKTLLTDDGAEINLGNADNSHYLRLFSGRDNFPYPIIYWKPGDPLVFGTNSIGQSDFTEWMRIKSSGEVGIGVDNPINSLHIKGPKWVGLSIEAGIYDPFIQLSSSTAGPLTYNREWTIRNDVSNDKSFEVNYNNGTGMTMDTLGRVGIRTDEPNNTLDVNGNLTVRGLASSPYSLLSHENGNISTYNSVTAINASSFHCTLVSEDTPYTSTGRYAWGGRSGSTSTCISMVSDVQFLHGDLINSFTVRFLDSSSSKNLRFKLIRIDENGSYNELANTTLIAEEANQISRTDVFISHTVDNLNNSYYVTFEPVNSSGTPVIWDSSIRIVAVNIR